MTKDRAHTLFTPSGCLSMDAMKRYEQLSLTADEKTLVEKHLASCEFCRDALEGLSLLSDPAKLDAVVSEINDNLRTNLEDGKTPRPHRNLTSGKSWFYSGIAAAVLILFGILMWLSESKFSGKLQHPLAETINVEEYLVIPDKPYPEGQSRKSPEIVKPVEKKQETPKRQQKVKARTTAPKKEKTTPAASEKQSVTANREQDLSSLKILKGSDSIIKSYFAGAEKNKRDKSHGTLDIASAQPLEYYIGEVVVYNDAIAQPVHENNAGEQMSIMKMQSNRKARASNTSNGDDSVLGQPAMASEDREEASSSSMHNESSEVNAHFFTVVGKMPEFPGGRQALSDYFNRELKYPLVARQNGIQGTVYLSFVIEPDGTVSDVKVIRGIGGGCDEVALKAIQEMPAWVAARQNHPNVPVLITIPVSFKLR